jgi:transmembrane sensor
VSERLAEGDWMRVGWNGDVRRGQAPPDEVGSWLRGQIVARDRPLADVIDDLRRYCACLILLTDGALGELRVSGVYNVSDPIAALAAMAGAHGGSVRQLSPWVLVVTGG